MQTLYIHSQRSSWLFLIWQAANILLLATTHQMSFTVVIAITREVIQEKSAGITPSGKQVVKNRTQVSSPEDEDRQAFFTFTNIVYYIAGILEVVLTFRFVLKLLGANPGSWFVSFIYSVSSPLESPFRGIFSAAVNEGIETRSVFEPSTLVAIFVYALLAMGIAQLVRVFTEKNQG
jgi:hypothetical protein